MGAVGELDQANQDPEAKASRGAGGAESARGLGLSWAWEEGGAAGGAVGPPTDTPFFLTPPPPPHLS